MKAGVWISPEGNCERVEFCSLPNEESPVTRDSHQHVFSLTAGQTRVVPPARKTHTTHAEIRRENTGRTGSSTQTPASDVLLLFFPAT